MLSISVFCCYCLELKSELAERPGIPVLTFELLTFLLHNFFCGVSYLICSVNRFKSVFLFVFS